MDDLIFRNLTPHEIHIVADDGAPIAILPAEGLAIRVIENVTPIGHLGAIPVVGKTYSGVDGLPDPEPGVLLVVSVLVLNACPDRPDLICPDTGPGSVLRDEKGRIMGVRRFHASDALAAKMAGKER